MSLAKDTGVCALMELHERMAPVKQTASVRRRGIA
jgi:hypothetical protein